MAIQGGRAAQQTICCGCSGTELRGEGRLALWDRDPGPSPPGPPAAAAGSAWSGSNRRCPPPAGGDRRAGQPARSVVLGRALLPAAPLRPRRRASRAGPPRPRRQSGQRCGELSVASCSGSASPGALSAAGSDPGDEPVSALDPVLAQSSLDALLHRPAPGAAHYRQPACGRAGARRFPRIIGLREGRVLFDCPAPPSPRPCWPSSTPVMTRRRRVAAGRRWRHPRPGCWLIGYSLWQQADGWLGLFDGQSWRQMGNFLATSWPPRIDRDFLVLTLTAPWRAWRWRPWGWRAPCCSACRSPCSAPAPRRWPNWGRCPARCAGALRALQPPRRHRAAQPARAHLGAAVRASVRGSGRSPPSWPSPSLRRHAGQGLQRDHGERCLQPARAPAAGGGGRPAGALVRRAACGASGTALTTVYRWGAPAPPSSWASSAPASVSSSNSPAHVCRWRGW